MRLDTRRRKNATRGFKQICGKEKLVDEMFHIFCKGKQGLDVFLLEIGRMVAETIMYSILSGRRLQGQTIIPFLLIFKNGQAKEGQSI